VTQNGVVGLLGVFRGKTSALGRWVVIGEVLWGFGMWWGGWDWVRANSGCLSEGSVVGPYVVAGLCGCPGTSPSLQRAGGMYTGGLSRLARVVARKRSRRVVVT
jgi:hypothetical protein